MTRAAAIILSASTALAAVPVRIDAPAPVPADMEASASAAMPAPTGRAFRLALSLDASPANSACAALGGSDPGPLEPDRTAVIIGWDRGAWYIRGNRLRERHAAPAANPHAAGERRLTLRVRKGAGRWGDGHVSLFEERWVGGAMLSRSPVVFAGLAPETLLSWLGDPSGWTTLSAVSRGGTGNVSATASYHADGTLLILR